MLLLKNAKSFCVFLVFYSVISSPKSVAVEGYDDTKGMRTEADFHTAMWGTPWYDEADVAHFSETQTSAVGVGSQYCFPWTIGAFSTDGYAPATIVSPNGDVTFEGIIDRQGQFRVVYKVY